MAVVCTICGGAHPHWECTKKTAAPAVIKTPQDAAKALEGVKARKKAKSSPAGKKQAVPSIVGADVPRSDGEPAKVVRMGRPPVHQTIESLRAAAAERARKYRAAKAAQK